MKKPYTHNAKLARLPSALTPLTDEKRWVNWSWELRKSETNDKPKWTKPPRRPRDLELARSNDSTTWGSYERAVHRWKDGDADGVGFMLLGSGIGAADLDRCCTLDAEKKTARIDAWARTLRAEAGDAYCEVTVSGTGLRLIGTAAGPEVHRGFKIDNAHPEAKIELYRNTARFITISGLKLAGDCRRLPSLDDFIDATLARYDQHGAEADNRQPIDRYYHDLIRSGAQQGERSELFHQAVWHLANRGWNIEQIVQKLARHPKGIGLKYADRLHQEVTRSYNKWQRRNPVRRQELPIIRSVDGQIARVVDEAQTALLNAAVPIFVRGGMLVEPITVERQAAHNGTTLVTVFTPVNAPKLGYLLNKHAAVFNRYDLKRKKWVVIDPPLKAIAALATLRSWKFSEVVGIVSAPTMRPDGSILSDYGYDPHTRLWCNSDIKLLSIPAEPTRAQAEAALQLLSGLLSGFPFVSAVDRAVALAAVLTAVLRGAFDVVPLTAVLAHDAGMGKSYLIDLIAVIISGRQCPVITGSKSPEELEKRLGSLLLEGTPMTSLDNLSHDIEGDLLAQMVTQTYIKIRILGRSEMPECEWRGTLFATGNNIRVVGDMIRRTLVCRLDAETERPELRSFKFDPIERVLRNRGAYIAAAITISRAFMCATSKVAHVSPLVGFDGWSKAVREALVWLGEQDPVSSMETARSADPERVAARELTHRWSKCIGIDKPVTARKIIEIANGHGYPNFRAFLLEHAGTMKGDQIDPVRLGRWLQKEHGRVYGALRIDVVSHKGRGNEYVLRKIDKLGDGVV